MDTYTITRNQDFDSFEVEFPSKPQMSVIAALKALRMRWNPRRNVWYGFADEQTIISAIQAAQPESVPAQVATDGYLGGGAVAGAKSNRYLCGSELSAAIRADLKRAGIKGVTVRSKTYSGGQSLSLTITAGAADLVGEAAYIAEYVPAGAWVELGDGEILHRDDYYARLAAEPELRIRAGAAEYRTRTCVDCVHTVSQYYIERYNEFTADFRSKLTAVDEIVRNYRYDNSNSIVDYFDVNFYYDLTVVIKG